MVGVGRWVRLENAHRLGRQVSQYKDYTTTNERVLQRDGTEGSGGASGVPHSL